MVEHGLDVGFAYDGDADRCIAVDHRGNIIDGDKIMYVCGKYLKEQGRLNGNTVVTTIMLSLIHILPATAAIRLPQDPPRKISM